MNARMAQPNNFRDDHVPAAGAATAPPNQGEQGGGGGGGGTGGGGNGALRELFESVALFVRLEMQLTGGEYELLEKMNERAAAELTALSDLAADLAPAAEALDRKSGALKEYLDHVDAIDCEVTELEAVVSTLDARTESLLRALQGSK